MSIKFRLSENDGMHESFYFGITTEDCKNEMFWMSKGEIAYTLLKREKKI